MKNFIRRFHIFVLFFSVIFIQYPAISAADTGIVERWNMMYRYGSTNGDDYDSEPPFGAITAGYNLKEWIELGIGWSKTDNDEKYRSSHITYNGNNLNTLYKEYAFGPYAKINALHFNMSKNSSLQLYGIGTLDYVKSTYDNDLYVWAAHQHIYSKQRNNFLRLGYGFGLDISFGKNKNYIFGLQYRTVAAGIGGKSDFSTANFSNKISMGSFHFGWRFGKSDIVEEEKTKKPLMNTINGLSESEWNRITGGKSELDFGNFHPNGNFGGYGNSWFGN